MKINRRINTLIFPLLLVICAGVIAWASTQKIMITDLTRDNRLSLSEPSQAMIKQIDGPIEIDVFVNRSDQLGERVQLLIDRYQRLKPDLTLNFVSPEKNPDKVREHSIRYPAEMLIHYQGRTGRLEKPSEEGLTNALAKLLRKDDRWLVFLSGHGERDPAGEANFDMGKFSEQLLKRGLRTQTLNLSETGTIPDNTAALVIADPQVEFLEDEWKIIHRYLEKGGSVLCMTEPGHTHLIKPLANKLDVDFFPGTVVDAIGQQFNITQPDLIPIISYPDHPISKDFTLTSLFPNAVALNPSIPQRWEITPLITSSEQSWTETSPIENEIHYDEDHEHRGPLVLALALIAKDNHSQRILISGDSDFLSNTYLNNGGNLDLGVRIMNWISSDDQLINIPFRAASDLDFEMNKTMSAITGLGFLIVLPLFFLITGFVIWWRRRNL